MYNPQQYAIDIEHILNSKGLASYHVADEIRKAPIDFLDAILSIYEEKSERNYKASVDFWDKYERYQGKRLDDFDDEFARQLVSDIRKVFNA